MPSPMAPRCGFSLQLQSLSNLAQCHASSSLRANASRTHLHRPQPIQLSPSLLLRPRFYATRAVRNAKPFKTPARAPRTAPAPIPRHPPSTTTQSTTIPAKYAPNPNITTNTPTSLLAQTLAAKPTPTLLYLAPTSNAYALTCLGVGVLSTVYGVWHLYDAYLVPHPGLWWLVPHMMAGVSVFMIGAGIWVGLGSRRLVGSLTAVPKAGGLVLRMEGRSALPFFPGKTIETPVESMRLASPTAPIAAGVETAPGSPSSFYADLTGGVQRRPLNAAAIKRANEAKRLKEREKETLFQTLTGPPRVVLRAMFKGIGRVVAREGFVALRVDGKVWKVDARDGWLLDEGVGVDRLLMGR